MRFDGVSGGGSLVILAPLKHLRFGTTKGLLGLFQGWTVLLVQPRLPKGDCYNDCYTVATRGSHLPPKSSSEIGSGARIRTVNLAVNSRCNGCPKGSAAGRNVPC